MGIHHNADMAGSDTPEINHLTEEVAALARACAMLEAATKLVAVTQRSLEDRPPDPQMDAPRTGGNGEGRGDIQTRQIDFPTDADIKQFALLAAKAARNGITLIALSGGGYLLCRWGMSRAVPSLGVVASLLRQMGISP